MNAIQTPLSGLKPLQTRFSAPQFDLGWAAGFLDGEGCIHLARQTYPAATGRKPIFRLVVHIAQNNLEVLDHFKDGLGIHAKLYRSRRTLSQNRQGYQLHYTGQYAMQLLAVLAPLLVRKRPEAEVAMNYWILGRAGVHFGSRGIPADVAAYREQCYRKLRRLK